MYGSKRFPKASELGRKQNLSLAGDAAKVLISYR